jgi:flagellar biosynthesis protein FlhF
LVQSAKAPTTPEQQPAENQDAPRRSARPRASSSRKKAVSNIESLTEVCELDAFFRHLETRYTVFPELSSPDKQQRIVVFIGPPGAGKTTTLVKLAMTYGTLRKTPVQILSADTLRLGGAEQLHSYSRILGTGFQAVSGRRALEQAIEEYASKKIILIDTPGFAPADMDEATELADFANAHADVDVQLVLPATLHASSMYSAVSRFRPLCPSKLVFTHLDEMDTPACLIETAIRSALPISFLANGQQIPENVTEASKTELHALLGARLKQGLAVAA